jgi:hypothetical protein
MDKKQIVFLLLLAMFCLAFFCIIIDDLGVRQKNARFYDACITEEQQLINVCKIDYNAFLVEQKQKLLQDLNKSFQNIENGVN